MNKRELITFLIIAAIAVPDVTMCVKAWTPKPVKTEITAATETAIPIGSPASGPEEKRPDYYASAPEIIDTININDLKPALQVTDEERLMMEKIVHAEAGNQELMGKRLVADVIINRVLDADFPGDSVKEVIEYPGAFSSYTDGGYTKAIPDDTDKIAVMEELEGVSNPEILYFTAGDYGKYGTPWMQVQDHWFCTK